MPDPTARVHALSHAPCGTAMAREGTNPSIMKTLITCWCVFASVLAFGQADQMKHPGTDCLLHTTAEEWSTLHVTQEQLDQVKAIQTDCKTDCMAPKEEGVAKDPETSRALLMKHEERLRAVLNADQYGQWLKLCEQRSHQTGYVEPAR